MNIIEVYATASYTPRNDIHTYLHFFKRLFPSVHWLWQVQTIEEGHILATSPESDLLEVGMGSNLFSSEERS